MDLGLSHCPAIITDLCVKLIDIHVQFEHVGATVEVLCSHTDAIAVFSFSLSFSYCGRVETKKTMTTPYLANVICMYGPE